MNRNTEIAQMQMNLGTSCHKESEYNNTTIINTWTEVLSRKPITLTNHNLVRLASQASQICSPF